MPDATVARAASPRGDVILRRRARDGALELRVNGVFVMDSRETATERAIATLALDCIQRAREVGQAEPEPLRVLIGGLGLGYTLAELAGSPLVGEILVSEIEPALVEWHRRGRIPSTANLIRTPGIRIVVSDVRDLLGSRPAGTVDVVVLDVDNGPGFLVYDDNAPIYETEFLGTCRETLAENGVLVVWSSDEAPTLRSALESVFGSVSHHPMAVTLGHRVESYHAYVARRRPEEDEPCPVP